MGIRVVVRTKSATESSDAIALEFDQARIALGRGAGADIPLPHVAVSALHATIRIHNAGYALFDESSTNGTRVGGTKLAPGRAKPLRSGDVLAIGPFRIEVHIGVPVSKGTSIEDTLASARRLARAATDPSRIRKRPTLLIQNGARAGTVIELPPPPASLIVGRDEVCDVALDDADCSREHCSIEVDELGVVVRDSESKNGVLVNERLTTERRLRDRDEVRLGHTVLVFEDPVEHELDAIRSAPDAAYDDADEGAEVPHPQAHAIALAPPAMATEFSDTDAPAFSGPAPTGAEEPSKGSVADGLVYGLAGTILVLSILAMYFLLRTG